MRKILSLLLTAMIMVSLFTSAVFARQEISLFFNDEEVEPGTPVVFQNQRTMITLDSGFFKKAGVETAFNKETGTVTLDGEYSTIEFTIGEKEALIHRKYDFSGIPEIIEMDVAPFELDGEVYIPLRFAAESLGALVEWDAVNNSVLVTFEKEMDIIPVERPVDYEEIDLSVLSDEDELYSWVQENRIKTGIYHKIFNNKNYVLICAGEKPTGGYSIEIKSVTQIYPGRIFIDAEVIEPSPDMMVTQVITYPCMLIVIDSNEEFSVDGDINNNSVKTGDELLFETVSPEAIAADEELSAWINGLYTEAGVHCRQTGEYVYALIAAGQKNTGGYSVIVEKVTKDQSGDVYIHAVVNSPDPDAMVIQVITWPYTVIRFDSAGVDQIHGEVQGSSRVIDAISFE